MNVLLDNIIYSLQRGGGASVVWTEHIIRLLEDKRFEPCFIEYSNAGENVFRKTFSLPSEALSVKSANMLKINRYFDLKNNFTTPYVFHSSHYRIDKNKFARNITTVHDFVYEYFVSGIKQKIHSYQKWNSIKKADAVICISESTKRDLLHFIPDVDEEKIIVIHNGVDNIYHPLDRSDYKMDLPFDTREYILYVGNRHTPYKNFQLVLSVCAETHMPLVMVGGEIKTDEEAKMLEDSLGEGRFMFLRGLKNEELNELYNRAYALLYPSLYEGFGIPVIEAQRAGVPVISSYRSSIPEIVGDSELSIKGEITKERMIDVLKALDNTMFRTDEVKKGLDNSKRFSWNKTYQQTTDLYLKLLK